MKVVHIVPHWLPLTMIWLYNQISFLKGDVQSHIVCEETSNREIFPQENLYCLKFFSIFRFYLQKGMRMLGLKANLGFVESVIQNIKPNLIHSHFGDNGWSYSKLASQYRLKHLVSFYGYDVNMIPNRSSRWKAHYQELFSLVDGVLCEGPYMAESILRLGCPKNKILTQRLGIDTKKIPFRSRRGDLSKRLRFLIVGTFREKKGIPFALEALSILKKKNFDFDVTIIGDATAEKRDRKEKKRILETIQKIKLENQVNLLGFQDHVSILKAFYRHDLLLSPSISASNGDTEGGAPVTIIEAAASGMPVISTLHCDIPNVLGPLNNSFLVDERDVEGLAHSIEKMIEADWSKIGLDNRSFIERKHDIEVTSKEVHNIYRKLLS